MTTSSIRQIRSPRFNLLLLTLLGGLALAVGAAVWLLASGFPGGRAEAKGPSAAAQAAFEEKTGVRLVRVAVTGNGGILDLRYRVIDPDKAPVVHDPSKRPAIVDQKTGQVVGSPLMGMWMHAARLKPGVVYYQLLVNHKGLVEAGERVSVRLGGVSLRDVLVR